MKQYNKVVMTQYDNVWYPQQGDFISIPPCGGQPRKEGVVVKATWVNEGRHKQYTLLTVLDIDDQVRFQVKHTLFLDESAPEGAINWFF